MDLLEFNWVQLWFQKLNALILKTGLFSPPVTGGGGGEKGGKGASRGPLSFFKSPHDKATKVTQSKVPIISNVLAKRDWHHMSCHQWCYDDVFFYQKRILNLPQSWHLILFQTRKNRGNRDRKKWSAYNLGFLGSKKTHKFWNSQGD